jgi:Tfp pilus assembly protein PilF
MLDRRKTRAAFYVLAGMLAGCVAPSPELSDIPATELTPTMLLDGSPLVAEESPSGLGDVDVLELTPEMIAFVEAQVDQGLSPTARLNSLLRSVMGGGKFKLIYDDSTRTAAETFEARRGNCLSFTNLFVAFARHLELDAHFQEVEIAPDWSSIGQSSLFTQHVNVLVDFRHYTSRVVDFNFSYAPEAEFDFDFLHERRVVPDERARAHFFNNLGAERMLADRAPIEVHAYFRESLTSDPTFAAAWTNLGTLYRRSGLPGHAEASYLQALAQDNSSMVAMSNLASLYDEQGRVTEYEYYRDRVERHRDKNPYWHFALAKGALLEGDYAAARQHLEVAIKKREGEANFYALMGFTYAMTGEVVEARRWLDQAETLAREDADRRRFQEKFELLMSLGEPR